ncbi:hypothetical protein ACFPL7_17430 [Dongia soli]|uniref:Uncharacterized protein n=1 Tax=Dongia soli TaxID=600628 RepID=A0ABU5E743_9PROT|nr:hypothetical protein [Dongia soli]MDY0881373.1 hypothetical protein [Dongia soli]
MPLLPLLSFYTFAGSIAGLAVFLPLVERLSSNTATAFEILAQPAAIGNEKASDSRESLAFFMTAFLMRPARSNAGQLP